jgi:cardiolipin synthase
MLISHPPAIHPSFISKMTTTFQISTVLLALLTEYGSFFKQLTPIAIYGTTFLTVLSGIHYLYVGTRILNQRSHDRYFRGE